jgi:hypothetical protein
MTDGQEHEDGGSDSLGVLWRSRYGRTRLEWTDGCILDCEPGEAPWLPGSWPVLIVPLGFEWPRLRRWFEAALSCVQTLKRAPPAQQAEARDWVEAAYVLLRELSLQDSPVEPRGDLDVRSCLAELRDVEDFVRRAMTKGPKAEGVEKVGEKKPEPPTGGTPAIPGTAPKTSSKTIPEMLRETAEKIKDDNPTESRCMMFIADSWDAEQERAKVPIHTAQVHRDPFLSAYSPDRKVGWDSIRRRGIDRLHHQMGKWDIPLSFAWGPDFITATAESRPKSGVSKLRTKTVRNPD